MEKLESIIAVGIVVIIVLVFIFINYDNNSPNTTSVSGDRSMTIQTVPGMYIVENDKNAFLSLNDDGTYYLNVNICQGYLELRGIYEVRTDKLVLINRNKYPDYESLKNNEEINFSKIDNKFILEEDIECMNRGTVFKMN